MEEFETREYDYKENIIEDLGLTEMQVLNIISEWYTNGMMPHLIYDENCTELDEIADTIFYEIYDEMESIRNIKL